MDLSVKPDLYSPSIDKNGNYVDIIPSFNFDNGFYCPCGSRKDHVYTTKSKLSAHIKSKCHQNWLQNINLNKNNYYAETEKLKEINKNQMIIIAQQTKEISTQILTIKYLTEKLVKNDLSTNDNNNGNITKVKIDNLIDLN